MSFRRYILWGRVIYETWHLQTKFKGLLSCTYVYNVSIVVYIVIKLLNFRDLLWRPNLIEVAVLDVKLKQLFITCGLTVSVLESKKDIAINRQIESLRALSKDVEQSCREVDLLKITKGEEEAEISSWNAEVEEKLSRADEDIKRLENWQDEYKQNKESIAREEQLKFEIKLHETKLQLQSEQSTKMSVKQPTEGEKEVAVKLPKLVISKFDGSFTDWNRLWGQFSESIEKSGIANVVKFSYLKELLGDKVRRDVESLPFTSEGYNRAKATISDKIGGPIGRKR